MSRNWKMSDDEKKDFITTYGKFYLESTYKEDERKKLGIRYIVPTNDDVEDFISKALDNF